MVTDIQQIINQNSHAYKPIVLDGTRLELGQRAYHGIVGKFVKSMAPITEADPAALLGHYLIYYASVVGREAYHLVEGRKHFPCLFIGLVGESSKGRKGTANSRTEQVFREACPEFVDINILSGLYSAEGLIHHVRDSSPDYNPEDDKTASEKGVSDKRRLFIEEELSSPFYRMTGQQANTLSSTLRRAWDGLTIQTVIKNNPDVATGAHINVMGHGVKDEMVGLLNQKSLGAGGLLNRFIWLHSERAQEIPRPPQFPDNMGELISDLQQSLGRAEKYNDTLIGWEPSAASVWDRLYPSLSNDTPGLVGNLTKRAEAQTVRLALLYAIMDGSNEIRTEHLLAGVAVWQYSAKSVTELFGDAAPNPMASKLVTGLRGYPDGMTRGEIHKLFNNHKDAKELNKVIGELKELGNVEETEIQTNGRRKTVVRLVSERSE